MWETDPDKKPSNYGQRFCSDGNDCFLATWTGCKWITTDYYGNQERVKVDFWLRTPKDDQ